MGFFDDLFKFEGFQIKDWWDKARDNPEQLFFGGADPLGAKILGGITGKEYEPFIDQMGGPYGGHTISAFGNNDGGVYGRAEKAGINTDAGAAGHDAAHVVASIFGGQGLQNAGQGLLGGGGGGAQNLGMFGNGGANGLQGLGGGNAGVLAQQGGIQGGAGMGSATAGGGGLLSSMQPQDYMKMAQGMGGQPQQQPMTPPPQPQANNRGALVAQIQRQQRAQELRRKLRRTAEENMELRELTQTGLLSNA